MHDAIQQEPRIPKSWMEAKKSTVMANTFMAGASVSLMAFTQPSLCKDEDSSEQESAFSSLQQESGSFFLILIQSFGPLAPQHFKLI